MSERQGQKFQAWETWTAHRIFESRKSKK